MRTMKKSKMICAAVLTGVLAAAAPLPADHYVGGDASTHEIDGPRAECITCHPVAQE